MNRPLIAQDQRARQGGWLLIASLSIFFFCSMLLFGIFVGLHQAEAARGGGSAGYSLPLSFLPSTMLLVGISLSLHYAVTAAKLNMSAQVLRLSWLAMLLAMVFFAVQSEGMYSLIARSVDAGSSRLSPYKFTFVLALLHALHVVGGIIALGQVLVQAHRSAYDHERYWGIEFCAVYWHFLDVVWLVMMLGFVITVFVVRAN